MKTIVPVKRGPNLSSSTQIIDILCEEGFKGLDYMINPFDETAVEEALRLKEINGGEVVVVSIGPLSAISELRVGLAMGADRGILIEYDGYYMEPFMIARALKEVVTEEKADLVLMGKQAADVDNGQCRQILSQLLEWSLASFVSYIEQ